MVVVAVVAALLVIGAVVTYRMARSNDTVESFRRQIDALSPEARRDVVDQVNRIDDSATQEPDVPDVPDAPDARPPIRRTDMPVRRTMTLPARRTMTLPARRTTTLPARRTMNMTRDDRAVIGARHDGS